MYSGYRGEGSHGARGAGAGVEGKSFRGIEIFMFNRAEGGRKTGAEGGRRGGIYLIADESGRKKNHCLKSRNQELWKFYPKDP